VSESLQAKAEILKLARILGREPETLEYLERVPAADIRALREQVTDMLFSAHSQTLSRLAAASRLVPVGLVAMIGEKTFGPVLSARMAALLDPGRAVEMADKLPTPFLADVAIAIDPRRASEVIGRIPSARVAEVTRELLRRGEYVTMGRFIGHLSDEAIAAAVAVMDEAALLQIAFVLEDKDRLDRLTDLLSEQRLDRLIQTAANADLWAEALDLLSRLDVRHRAALVNRPAAQDEAILESLIAAVQSQNLWDSALPLLELLPPAAQERVAAVVEALPPAERERISHAPQSRAARTAPQAG
jgi:hypothetical protein